MSNVVIDIAAEFTGKKAFKQAGSSTDKLNKSVKNLGRTLGLTLSVGAVLAFAKASVKAAAEDEKAQKQLALALKNVGLGRDVAITESYISKLESEFGVVDDKLRPAYQSLAIATQSTSESQKLLAIALDISSANSLDLESVTSALSKAYLGNNTSLGKLGVGISKADLKTKSFDEIVNDLAKTFKGAATTSAKTFSGQLAKLSVSVSNAQEIIGKGLIDSLMILTESENIDVLQTKIVEFATAGAEGLKKLASVIKENETMLKSIAKILAVTFVSTKIIAGIVALIRAIKAITTAMAILRATSVGAAIAQMAVLNPFAAAAFAAGLVVIIGATIKGIDALTGKYLELNGAMNSAQGLAHLAELESRYPIKILATKKKITAEELKTLKAKQLQLAIDKANLALGKGGDVFDMEKISLAAAERNQAEQLGKVTSQAQLLQITNDLARLEIKSSILALEEAIASKDVAAITAATKKLNADLGILGVLTGQELKLRDIETILKGILPKDLINLANLDAAILKLITIGKATGSTTVISDFISPTDFLTGNNKTGSDAGDAELILANEPATVATTLSPATISGLRYAAQGIAAMNDYLALVAANMGGVAGASFAQGIAGGNTVAASLSGSRYAAQASAAAGITVVINAGTIADPDKLVTLVKDAIISLNKTGDATTFAGSL